MKFKRMFKGGAADGDPRQKTYLEYVCDCCGEEKQEDITRKYRMDKSSLPRLREEADIKYEVCPICKQRSKDDYATKLKAEIAFYKNIEADTKLKIQDLERKLEECLRSEAKQ